MTICFLIPSLALGGMERVMSLLLGEFSKKNIELHLILYGKDKSIEYPLPENVTIHQPSFSYSKNTRLLFTLKTMLFIRKEVKKLKPSTILSFGEYWNNLVLLSLSGLKYPIYISDRSQPKKNLGSLQNKLRDFLYPKASGYIAQTTEAFEIANKNKWNSNVIVIGNPIMQVEDNNRLEKQNTILTVGRLIPTKHIDELIELFRLTEAYEWRLIIVGGDSKNMSLLSYYKGLVKKLGMQNRVYLEGAQTNVADYYRKAKIFAFTSSSEGFPNVIGEAMAHGLPVISYNCTAGPSDLIVDGETGFLIEERDQMDYVTKLKKLIQDSDLRNHQGKQGKIKVKDFEASLIAEQYYDFMFKTTK